jgi:membrane protein implicated in regulation of membrane protease activity
MGFITELDPLLQVFWYIALPVSLIFLIQAIITIMGLSADSDIDMEGDLDSMHIFSFRNLINFLLGFSWAGIGFYSAYSSKNVVLIISILVGLAFVVGFFYLITALNKLAEDNSFKIEEALGKNAEVYLRIPGKRSGKGKILVSVKGSLKELDAMTDDDQIPTGANVQIIDIEGKNILIVQLTTNLDYGRIR